jgi:hypothetical protein
MQDKKIDIGSFDPDLMEGKTKPRDLCIVIDLINHKKTKREFDLERNKNKITIPLIEMPIKTCLDSLLKRELISDYLVDNENDYFAIWLPGKTIDITKFGLEEEDLKRAARIMNETIELREFDAEEKKYKITFPLPVEKGDVEKCLGFLKDQSSVSEYFLDNSNHHFEVWLN